MAATSARTERDFVMAAAASRHSLGMRDRLVIAPILAALLTGCGTGDEPHPSLPVHLDEEAGFFDIEARTISIDDPSLPAETTTTPARIFYAFQPADASPEKKPLFVFFNGGPGFATTLGLFANNTARRSLDSRHNGGAVVGPSPRPWTAMGNLLYLDARQSGFSYDHGVTGDARAAAFNPVVYNPFADAGDCVRAVLRFLAAHPEIREQPVILVGESYGGTRAAAMLFEIQRPDQIEAPSARYRDEALAAEIRAHFAATRPGEPFTPDLAAEQFGKQVLIEPAVMGQRQFEAAKIALGSEGSPLPEVAAELGVSCSVCAAGDAWCDPRGASEGCFSALRAANRDVGDLSLTEDEVTAQLTAMEAALRTTSSLQTMLGVDPRTIPGLAAAARADAFRFGTNLQQDGPAPNDVTTVEPLTAELGALGEGDRYFVGQNNEVTAASGGSSMSYVKEIWGAVFLVNLERTDTFITSARYDGIVYSPAIGDALRASPWVQSATLDRTPRKGVARPGWLTIESTPLGETTAKKHVIRMPLYAAGHAVPAGAPVELAEDVEAWLAGRE